MHPTGHSMAQKEHPIQAFSSFRYGYLCGSFTFVESARLRQFIGQESIQIVQDMHCSLSILGLAHRERFTMVQGVPIWSSTAFWGHIRPHAPHSMHTEPSMVCTTFFSPDIASTGQSFTHAWQPLHTAVIVYDMVFLRFLTAGQ